MSAAAINESSFCDWAKENEDKKQKASDNDLNAEAKEAEGNKRKVSEKQQNEGQTDINTENKNAQHTDTEKDHDINQEQGEQLKCKAEQTTRLYCQRQSQVEQHGKQ